jgi:hypothetical protein
MQACVGEGKGARKDSCSGFIGQEKGRGAMAGVMAINARRGAGGFDSNSRGAWKGVTEGESKGGVAASTTPRIEE